MTDEAIEARRAYKRRWAREHPDKVREQQRRYWEKRAQQQATEQAHQQPDENTDTEQQ